MGQHGVEPRAVLPGALGESGQRARRGGKRLRPVRAQILDQRRLQRRLPALGEHAGDGDRHAAQGVELRGQPSKPLGGAQIGVAPDKTDKPLQRPVGFEKALRAAALERELARRLFPRHAGLAEQRVSGDARAVERHLVELVAAGHEAYRRHLDAGRRHVDQELAQPVTAVGFGRRRGAEQADHVVGAVRVAGPYLAPGQRPAPARRRFGAGLRREQVGARFGLAHADAERAFPARDARQYRALRLLVGVAQQHRAGLPIGDEMRLRRRVGGQHFLADDMAFEETALPPAVTPGPRHADPAARADAPAELAVERAAPGRVDGPRGDFPGQKRAHFGAQPFGLRGQADRGEVQRGRHGAAASAAQGRVRTGQNSSAPAAAAMRPSSAAQTLSEPKSSRHDHRRRVWRCRTYSSVKPMAPCI